MTAEQRPEWAEYMLDIKRLPDGRWVGLVPLTFGRARIVADCWEFGYGAFW